MKNISNQQIHNPIQRTIGDFNPFNIYCDNCACSDPRNLRSNSSGELQCENCGYSETE